MSNPRAPLALTPDTLRTILAAADDNAGPHTLWVDVDGNVRLEGPFRGDGRSQGHGAWIAANAQRIAFCAQTFSGGAGLCGPKAARDAAHVRKLFEALRDAWSSWTPSALGEVVGDV